MGLARGGGEGGAYYWRAGPIPERVEPAFRHGPPMRLLLLVVIVMPGTYACWGVHGGRFPLLVDRGVGAGAAIVDTGTSGGSGATSPLQGTPGSAAAVDTVEGVAA